MISGVMGLLLGAVFGSVQMIALRGAAHRAQIWIVVNALGWGVALPIIYAAASTGSPDMSRQLMILKALAAGLFAGLTLGGITGLGLRWMAPKAEFYHRDHS